jgi:8-oxo-dGTP pyrophosphatase MutT (NUDIX family)
LPSHASFELSATDIRERLSGTRPGDDPVLVDEAAMRDWPAGFRARLGAALTPAGVLVPIIERPGALSVLLTRRADHLKHHAGQVSFPGGRMEPGDADIVATALRETHEEVGIRPWQIEVAGCLAPMPTITGYAVTPVVGLVAVDVELALDRAEVELAFEVPLAFLLDPANEVRSVREIDGIAVPLVEFHHGGERIWGATASMIVSLRQYLVF